MTASEEGDGGGPMEEEEGGGPMEEAIHEEEEGGRPTKRAQTIQEPAKTIQESDKEFIIDVLQEEGVSFDPQWLNTLDLNELDTLSTGLWQAGKRNEVKEFWEKAQKGKATEDSALAALASAFTAPFVDPQQHLPMLLAKLDERLNRASMSTAPCASVIQSSGTGKTRSLVELSSLDVYVCYCSLQSKSGFPLRTSKLADDLIQEGRGEGYYRGYLKAWLEILCEHLHGKLKIASQPSASSDPSSLCKQWSLDHILMKKEQVSVVIDAVNEQWVRQRTCTESEAAVALRKVCPLLPRKEGVKILFVFDEAAQLFSNGAGNNIRRAFLSLLQSTFGVFVDTYSDVSVLAPSLDRDPSQRFRLGTLTVPPPVWEISNVNVLVENLTSFKDVEDLTLQRLFKYGRPLWASCMSSIADELKKSSHEKGSDQAAMQRAMKEAQALAARKLCGGVQENALDAIRAGDETLDTSTALAILGARLVIDVNPLSRLATNLVGSHMSYVLDISDGNRCITSWEPWDPIITHAAKDMFGHKGFRKAALGHLQKCMERHWVDEGKTGELVGQYILIRAMDTARKQQFVTLGDFLDVLVGSGAQDVLVGSGAQDVRQGLVNFSGFLPVTGYTPDLQDLLHAFILEKAFICRTNQARFDALIPVLLPEKDGSFLLEPNNMSILGIQLKNIYGDCDMDFDASIWMCPEAAGIGGWLSEQPFATVLMQLGRPGEGSVRFVAKDNPVTRSDTQKAAAKDQPSIKHLPFIVYGLEGVYLFLVEEELKVLQDLIKCRRHRLMVQSVKQFAKTIMHLCWERRHD